MKTIQTDTELLAAALAQINVTVRDKYDGKIEDYGGVIEGYTPDYARIRGMYYSRKEHVFTTFYTQKGRN